jgi:K+:H+ antiporter
MEGALVLRVLVAFGAVVVAARALGAVAARIRQPPVMGEILAGIVLGPSVLGALLPSVRDALFPAGVLPPLATIAAVGVVVYMFLVGLELNPALFEGQARAAAGIASAGIAVPFVLGLTAAAWLHPRYGGDAIPYLVFALFVGVAMSVTAFPVLARILTDRDLARTRLGSLALACAAVDDATAWCLLAIVSGIARSATRGAAATVLLTAAYAAAMLLVVRPVARRLVRPSPGALAAVAIALPASALATEWIGVHAVFGAFLLGAVMPHASPLAATLERRLHGVALVMLPAFFAYTGLRTQIGLLGGASDWLAVGAITAVATLGKLGGASLAARLSGVPGRDAVTLGVLMNTRGLMELIVLNVGLDMGVLTPALFTMFVLMAVATTFATAPVLDALRAGGAGEDRGRVTVRTSSRS